MKQAQKIMNEDQYFGWYVFNPHQIVRKVFFLVLLFVLQPVSLLFANISDSLISAFRVAESDSARVYILFELSDLKNSKAIIPRLNFLWKKRSIYLSWAILIAGSPKKSPLTMSLGLKKIKLSTSAEKVSNNIMRRGFTFRQWNMTGDTISFILSKQGDFCEVGIA